MAAATRRGDVVAAARPAPRRPPRLAHDRLRDVGGHAAQGGRSAGTARPPPGPPVAARRPGARAAARNIPSVTSRASATRAPRPTPGKMNALLPWPTRRVRPAWTTEGKGLPVATRARPSVQRRTSSGEASAWLVGLESGKIIGRSTCAAISRTTVSVKAPVAPETPMSTVGRSARTTASRSWPRPQAFGRGQRVRPGQLAPVVLRRPLRPRPPARASRARPPPGAGRSPPRPARWQRVAEQARDADPGRARAEDHDAVPAERQAEQARARPGCPPAPPPPCPGCRR